MTNKHYNPTTYGIFNFYQLQGGGLLAHIVFNVVPLNRFDSNLIHLLNLSNKGHNFSGEN